MRVIRETDGQIETSLRGHDLLHTPRVNNGTAFSLEERAALGLIGLLPPQVKSLEQQEARAYGQYQRQPDDLARNVCLTALHDRNDVIFYRLLTDRLREMLYESARLPPTRGNRNGVEWR